MGMDINSLNTVQSCINELQRAEIQINQIEAKMVGMPQGTPEYNQLYKIGQGWIQWGNVVAEKRNNLLNAQGGLLNNTQHSPLGSGGSDVVFATNNNNLFNSSDVGSINRFENETTMEPFINNTANKPAPDIVEKPIEYTSSSSSMKQPNKPGHLFDYLCICGKKAIRYISDGKSYNVVVDSDNKSDNKSETNSKIKGLDVEKYRNSIVHPMYINTDGKKASIGMLKLYAKEHNVPVFYTENVTTQSVVAPIGASDDTYIELLEKAYSGDTGDKDPLITLTNILNDADDDRHLSVIDTILTARFNDLVKYTGEEQLLDIDSIAEDLEYLITKYIYTITDLSQRNLILRCVDTLRESLKVELLKLKDIKTSSDTETIAGDGHKLINVVVPTTIAYIGSFKFNHTIHSEVYTNNKMMVTKEGAELLYNMIDNIYERSQLFKIKKTMRLVLSLPINTEPEYIVYKNIFGYVIMRTN